MDKKFDNILNECLERLLVKGETLEQCLQNFPEYAAELKPLLQTAIASKKALEIKPSAEFKAGARYQLRTALAESAAKRRRFSFAWLPRWATAVTLVLGLLMAGSGTVAAANYSMPDSPLYPIKIATEQVQLSLTRSDVDKAELDIKLADRRVAEIIYLANKGDAERIEEVTQSLDEHLEGLVTLVAMGETTGVTTQEVTVAAPTPVPASSASGNLEAQNTPPSSPRASAPSEKVEGSDDVGKSASQADGERAKIKAAVAQNAVNQLAVLQAVLEEAPESSKPALIQTINVLMERYKEALEALND